MPQEEILIADDERSIREVCIRALREDGYQVRAVASGAEAVAAAREERFDLFLTDLRMPGMSGLEAYKAIQQFRPEIIGVAMTGYATIEAAIEALQLGFHDFILKPFSPQYVRQTVTRVLEQGRLREENARLRMLVPLYQLTQAFMTITSLDDLLQGILDMVAQEAGVDSAAIFLLGQLGNELDLRAALGLPTDALGARVTLKEGDGLSHALEARQPLIWIDEQIALFPFAAGLSAMITLPLIVQGQTLGLMAAGKRPAGSVFTYGEMELLSVVAGQAAVAIKNAQLFAEIQQAYKKVEESDYLKSEFIAIASHELRTPLVSILGYAELLANAATGELAEQLNIVLGQAYRLRDIVNDMFSLTDLRAGMTEVTWNQVSLEEAIRKAADNLRLPMETKGVRLDVQVSEECAIIQADYERLGLVLSKLLSNAIKFSPQGEKVSVRAEKRDSLVMISVTDRGPGISPEAQENLFRPFYQVEESLRRSHGGMGLGLAIAKGMVELHGGQIWVESRVGEGSTFAFTIPQPKA